MISRSISISCFENLPLDIKIIIFKKWKIFRQHHWINIYPYYINYNKDNVKKYICYKCIYCSKLKYTDTKVN
jgi:hypothetical protein